MSGIQYHMLSNGIVSSTGKNPDCLALGHQLTTTEFKSSSPFSEQRELAVPELVSLLVLALLRQTDFGQFEQPKIAVYSAKYRRKSTDMVIRPITSSPNNTHSQTAVYVYRERVSSSWLLGGTNKAEAELDGVGLEVGTR